MSTVARKIATLVRCVERARAELEQAGPAFATDFTRQDAAILNVTRACEAGIDLANMVVRAKRLGVPGDAREAFALIQRGNLLDPELSSRLQKMIGFRNIAVHQYQSLDLRIVESVIRTNLDDLLRFAEIARGLLGNQ